MRLFCSLRRLFYVVQVVAYRHWTFPDDENVEDIHASYMMARKLTKRKRGAGPGETTRAVAEAAQKAGPLAAAGEGGNGGAVSGELVGGRQQPRREAAIAAEAKGKAPPLVSKEACNAMAAAVEAMKQCEAPDGLGGLRQRAAIFLDLPPRKHFPDYYQLIKQPVSIKVVERRIALTRDKHAAAAALAAASSSSSSSSGAAGGEASNRPYTGVEEFYHDVSKLFDNARQYNLPMSEVDTS